MSRLPAPVLALFIVVPGIGALLGIGAVPGIGAILSIGVLASAASAQTDELNIPIVAISGSAPAFEVRLAPADADSFRRRVNQPPRLEDPPAVSGPSYEVVSAYWTGAVRREDDDEDDLEIDVSATYFPEGGYVRASLGGEDVWMVISLRQRAILDRYVGQAQNGLIGDTPSTIEVLKAALPGEMFSLEVGGQLVPEDVKRELLHGLAQANDAPLLDPLEPPQPTSDGFWLVVTLVEGRALQYYYDGATLHESLGSERYDASSVADLLDTLAPASVPQIEQQEPAGSLLWWPVMVGGGFIAIGAAIWLRRRDTT